MSTKENKGGTLLGLQKSAGAMFSRLPFSSRFSAKTASPKASAAGRAFAPMDPTVALFPGQTGDEGEAGSLPLTTLLEQSAHAMARRKDDLREPAARLAARIAERREGEVTLAAQAFRVLIGLVWLGVAIWLYIAVLNARADGVSVVGPGIPLDDASVLMQVFLIVAGAGLGVAFGVAALTRAFGNADNDRIKKDAAAFGGAIADAADEFDSTLSALRSAMDRRGHPADAVDDLSRAHLTALEAHDFFREISFLNGAEDEHSRRMLRGFLARAAGGGAGPSPLLTFASGGLLGAFITYALVAPPRPEEIEGVGKATLAIMQYPWAAKLIVIGGLIYALVGAALSFFTGPLTDRVAEKARADALTAIRSGFAARSVLHPADISHRIKDAVDVFRARVGGGGSGGGARGGASRSAMGPAPAQTNHASADFSSEPPESREPEWRRRDSSVKFVDAGFSPAPESWRTDAFAKKFEAHELRGSEAKRDGEGAKKRRRD